MTTNRLTTATDRRNSPTDPQECCDWANARLRAKGDFERTWVTTDDPKQPIRLSRG